MSEVSDQAGGGRIALRADDLDCTASSGQSSTYLVVHIKPLNPIQSNYRHPNISTQVKLPDRWSICI
jgi:hypothetical protein